MQLLGMYPRVNIKVLPVGQSLLLVSFLMVQRLILFVRVLFKLITIGWQSIHTVHFSAFDTAVIVKKGDDSMRDDGDVSLTDRSENTNQGYYPGAGRQKHIWPPLICLSDDEECTIGSCPVKEHSGFTSWFLHASASFAPNDLFHVVREGSLPEYMRSRFEGE